MLLDSAAFAQGCGTTVYDTGGAGGNYGNNENFTWTYCPPAGQVIRLTFTAFNTEATYDELSIHNGPSNASPQIGFNYSGAGLPPVITGTIPGGCLTLWFTSDGTVVSSGWAINITCFTPPPPPPACGTTVYDPGGAGGDYPNSSNYTATYCPTVPGDVVTMNFSQFNTEAGYDLVTIYNGPSAGSPSMGTYSGAGIPGPFTSTDPSGCLTLVFTSDFIFTYPGWTATITCAPPPPPPAGDCVYLLTLYDSFGDGWGTSSVGVSIGGGPYTYYTVTGSFNQIPIGVYIGQTVVLTYNNSGTFQGENSYTLTLGSGTLFNSGSPPVGGLSYAATVNCQAPPAPPEDCIGSVTICSGQSFNNNTNNTGNVADLTTTTAGCLGALERQGTWYNFTPSAAGQVAFTLNPTDPLDDYDFAIWGPFPPGSTPGAICPPLSTPLRCSFAAPPGATGLNYVAADLTEDPFGDKWVRYLDVTVGQVYLLYISNYSLSGLSFDLSWNLAGGASLDCTQLGVELLSIDAKTVDPGVQVEWTTSSEHESSHFLVERSSDGIAFSSLGHVLAMGQSVVPVDYRFLDRAPELGMNYYRLVQVDLDGTATNSRLVSVMHGAGPGSVLVVPNPVRDRATVDITADTDGRLEVDLLDARGSTVKRMQFTLVAGPNRVPIPVEGIKAGAYTLRMRIDGKAPAQARLIKFD